MEPERDLNPGRHPILVGMERDKTLAELKEKQELATDLRDILARMERIREIFKEEMLELKRRFGKKDQRRTVIDAAEFSSLDEEDLISVEDAIGITLKWLQPAST